jgi:hypothetical protein
LGNFSAINEKIFCKPHSKEYLKEMVNKKREEKNETQKEIVNKLNEKETKQNNVVDVNKNGKKLSNNKKL